MTTPILPVPVYTGGVPIRGQKTNFSTYTAQQLTYEATLAANMNASISGINALIPDIENAATVALIAQGAANFKGYWSAATGAASVGWTYYHAVTGTSGWWSVAVALSDVTVSEPAVANTDYAEIPFTNKWNQDVDANGYTQSNTVFKNTSEKTQVLTFSAAIEMDIEDGNIGILTATGYFDLSIVNWPPSGEYGEVLLWLIDAGGYEPDLPTTNWILPNGDLTTVFSENETPLHASGIDLVLIWTIDGGTTKYGIVAR